MIGRGVSPLRALLLALALTWPVAASAGVVNALDGARYHLGDGQYTHTTDFRMVDAQALTGTHLEIPFRLGGRTGVSVRIENLWGVGGVSGQPHSNWVMINGTRVGRILPGHRRAWRSSPIILRPGVHRIRIVSEGPGDRDDFVLEGVSVVTTDRVPVDSAGSSRIWTEARTGGGVGSLGATRSDIDAWIDRRLETWEENQRARLEEENREALRSALIGDPNELAPEPIITAQAEVDTAFYQATDPPAFNVSGGAVRIQALALDPPGELAAGAPAPVALLMCRVDQAFVARGARPRIYWRWIAEGGTSAFGGGPLGQGALDRPDPTLRLPLPLAPPSPGRWTLEMTMIVDQWGDRATLTIEVH
jgi:hypothetical protein